MLNLPTENVIQKCIFIHITNELSERASFRLSAIFYIQIVECIFPCFVENRLILLQPACAIVCKLINVNENVHAIRSFYALFSC